MCAMKCAQEDMKGGKCNFWLGLAREDSPEVVTYEVEIAVKYTKSGLGRALHIEENAWAEAWWWEESIAHLGSIRKSRFKGEIKGMVCAAKGWGPQRWCLGTWQYPFLR